MKHTIDNLTFDSNEQGIMTMPSEQGSLVCKANARQFLLFHKRTQTYAAIKGLAEVRCRSIPYSVGKESEFPEELIALELSFTFQQGLSEKVLGQFQQDVAKFLAHSSDAGVRGERSVFVFGAQEQDNSQDSSTTYSFWGVSPARQEFTYSMRALLSTSVWYNDYRLTAGYPNNSDVKLDLIETIERNGRLALKGVSLNVESVESISSAL